MSALSEKIRKARELRVEVGGKVFVVLRPTTLDMIDLQGKTAARAIMPHIIGWEGVTSLDLYPGGDSIPVPFDSDACAEWLSDRVDLLGPIAQAAVDAYDAHRMDIGEAAKN
jgi:hypothetical protein